MRRSHRLALTLALLMVLSGAGCAGRSAEMDTASTADLAGEWRGAAPAAPAPPAAQSSDGERYGYGGTSALPSYQATATERLIIRTANVTMRVTDSAITMDALTGLVSAYDGYIADSNRWYSDDQLYASATLRVPADSLDAFLAEVRDLAIKVESENVTGDDVTEEYADIEAQLVNLRAAEVELRELLTEVRENRGSAEDILAVYRELSSVRGQIESLQGRQQYLSQMAAMSTVNLQLRPEAAPRAVLRERWRPMVTISNAANTLVEALKGLISALIYIVILSPIVLIPAAVIWLIVWLVRRGKRSRKVAEATTTADATGEPPAPGTSS